MQRGKLVQQQSHSYGLLLDNDKKLSPGCWIEDKELTIIKDGKNGTQNYDHTYRGMTLRKHYGFLVMFQQLMLSTITT